ncbi:MAG: porin [Gammaproteobacteria bacterium]|nr:porin [Gammaproteobacteria bacterium]
MTISALGAAKIEVDENHWVSIGAGIRTDFKTVEDSAPDGTSRSSSFNVENVRLYINGQVHEKVKFTFNTECESCVFGQDAGDAHGAGGDIDILDAIAQFEFSPGFNVWAGRMLTPADRIELNGPFYGLSWNQYTVPLLPSDQLGTAGLLGRDDGVTIWGAVDKFQYAVGLFDGVDGGPNQEDNLLFAGRVAYNFLNMESNPGYYTSSTYYGNGGDILTLAVSYQTQENGTGTAVEQGDFNATIIDALFEKVLGNGGVVTLEGEYKWFDSENSQAAQLDPTCFCVFDGEAYFITAAYLFPSQAGWGKFQPYIRYTSNNPSSSSISGLDPVTMLPVGLPDSDLTELGVNYIIKGHNLRLNFNYTTGDANLTVAPCADVDGVLFGVQIQI